MLEVPDVELRGPLHGLFKRRYEGNVSLLEYGLDFVKAMPKEWTDEKRLAVMVELYDELLIRDSLF